MEKALEKYEDVIIDIPLLVTSKYWQEKVDFIIVVDVDEQVQFERIKKRNGHSDEVIHQMMNSQPSRKEYKAIANYVFDNTSFENLDANIKACFEAIKGEK